MISGIVLAAGTASRFGRTKQILPVDGKPLAQHAIDALAEAGVAEILVVTGHDADAVEATITLPDHGRFVRNPAYRNGQATSLAAGLHATDPGSQASVILLGDQPGVGADRVRVLVDAFRRGGARIVRLRFRDGPGPALLSREIYDEAERLEGDTGARSLITAHPSWVEEVTVDADAPRDIDSPADLSDP